MTTTILTATTTTSSSCSSSSIGGGGGGSSSSDGSHNTTHTVVILTKPVSITSFRYIIITKVNQINPDIVHMHWICGGMMRIEQIANIIPPIVWSLHDTWAFTGGCHVMWDCEKYKDECHTCPVLSSPKENDLSRKVFIRKEKVSPKEASSSISIENVIGSSAITLTASAKVSSSSAKVMITLVRAVCDSVDIVT